LFSLYDIDDLHVYLPTRTKEGDSHLDDLKRQAGLFYSTDLSEFVAEDFVWDVLVYHEPGFGWKVEKPEGIGTGRGQATLLLCVVRESLRVFGSRNERCLKEKDVGKI